MMSDEEMKTRIMKKCFRNNSCMNCKCQHFCHKHQCQPFFDGLRRLTQEELSEMFKIMFSNVQQCSSNVVTEHVGCGGCKYDDLWAEQEPCCRCKETMDPDMDEYKTRPDLWTPADVTTDNVNHPNHYNREGGMECIEEMITVFGLEAVMNFCLLNVWKYRFRAADKNGQEDLKKSDWYMQKYKELKGQKNEN